MYRWISLIKGFLQRNKQSNNNNNATQIYSVQKFTVSNNLYKDIVLEVRRVHSNYAKQKYGTSTPEHLTDITFDKTFRYKQVQQVSRLINRYITAHFVPFNKTKSEISSISLYVRADNIELRDKLTAIYNKYIDLYIRNIETEIQFVAKYIQVFTIVLITAKRKDGQVITYAVPLYSLYKRQTDNKSVDKLDLHEYNIRCTKTFIQRSKKIINSLNFEFCTLKQILTKVREGEITFCMYDIVPLIKLRIFGLLTIEAFNRENAETLYMN